jgi:hypothetical protein
MVDLTRGRRSEIISQPCKRMGLHKDREPLAPKAQGQASKPQSCNSLSAVLGGLYSTEKDLVDLIRLISWEVNCRSSAAKLDSEGAQEMRCDFKLLASAVDSTLIVFTLSLGTISWS